ncbi:MAG: hypothetical protein CMC70_03310 [Flavobacteriaceae bacterium]|nr:hypothetical protein [Flavobacteriaceae bacterium]|tara:strand:- start:539 stop:916 length:378 start_codon:yes stop_codon:yes gene_type:complete
MADKEKHILIVEDSENILKLLELMLGFEGWKVSSLTSLDTIIENVSQIKPQIILMDMLLSGANGCDACIAIKEDEQLKNIPVIIMSAHPEAHEEAKAAGANGFVAKPFEMNYLIEKIEKAWQGHS